jgi:cyanophycinase
LRSVVQVDITLIGGGWDVPAHSDCLRPFFAAAAARSAAATPRIAVVLVDEGDGGGWGERWTGLLQGAGSLEPLLLEVPLGGGLDPSRLADVDGIFVCGGLTPAYPEVLAPSSATIRDLVLAEGVPYAGCSAGAAVAARHAVVGGYLEDGRVVCPPDSAEDLDDVTVVAGLGLVDELVDVHASSWGTLPRLATALRRFPGTSGVGLDEDTAWHVTDAGTEVLGRNAVHLLDVTGDEICWSVRHSAPTA